MTRKLEKTNLPDYKVVWEDLPPKSRHKGVWTERLAPVMDRPGQWARVALYSGSGQAASVVSSLNKRAVKVPTGKWEFAARRKAVYAKYVGPE